MNTSKRKAALISGVSGQVGSYLTELLLKKGYEVHGMITREWMGFEALKNLKHLTDDEEIYRKKLFFHTGDLSDASSVNRVIQEVVPDEIYNLAAQADVMESFYLPEMSVDVNGIGVIRVLEAMRRFCPEARLYQASTSELFGDVEGVTPQNEKTRFNPQSPYAWGKFVGFQAVKKYREMYGLYACNGILFNHESPRRGDDYLTRKVTRAAARIKHGLQKNLRLGNLEARRDWGYALDYAEVEWRILQQEKADDYCIGTGETHSVEEWVDAAFSYVGLNWKDYVIQDPRLFRPAEVDVLQADYSKARDEIGWEPAVRFNELVKIMMDADLEKARIEANSYAISSS